MATEKGIDFVLPWVDGNDPEWRARKNEYANKVDEKPNEPESGDDERFRDWRNLVYWFRSVEAYAPWVRKVFLVTDRQVPPWINTKCDKLCIVDHADYIPEEYLPTFSSHTIELNLHRINGLSDRFVYFNDDTFLTDVVNENFFFKDDTPCDVAALNVHCYSPDRPIQMIQIRDTGVINSHFDFKQSIKAHYGKWLNPKYGKLLLRTVPLIGCPRFPGFYQPHAPQAMLKSTLEELWREEPELLDATCCHRFRSSEDVNSWVVREWEIAKGNFVPRRASLSKTFFFGSGGEDKQAIADSVARAIKKSEYKMICINDSKLEQRDFDYALDVINSAFEAQLSEKSSFEK